MSTLQRVDELNTLTRAKYPIIYIISWEERRIEDMLREVALNRRKKLYGWTLTNGIAPLDLMPAQSVDPSTRDPLNALNFIAQSQEAAIFVLKDFHPFLDDSRGGIDHPVIIRRLRDITNELKESRKTLIILAPTLRVPSDLEKDITLLDYSLPTLDELELSLERVVRSAREIAGVQLRMTEEDRERVLNAARGLTCIEAENVFAKSLVMGRQLDLSIIVAEKEQLIRRSQILEYYETVEGFSNVGGMNLVKEWLRKRGMAFSEKARRFGLPEPKGLLLLGVQGAGKSLLAKAVASQWQLPLLRLDLGRVFSELVGSSEQNIRTALRLAENVSPCVLWLDEIEKGLAGSSGSGNSDAGTS
ncbi:MAG: AAA family ATPase, partial [Anaerolineae bacterium]|nr:AAA family ATPase [Anaerolineae bacterium]